MSSIRKMKRRTMRRLAEPRIKIKVPDELKGFFAGMTSIERENSLRACLAEYVRYHRRMKGQP